MAATLAVRQYFDHFSSYPRIYGRAAAAAMLLMWLYVTNAAVLIGAEMNSENRKGPGGERRRTAGAQGRAAALIPYQVMPAVSRSAPQGSRS
jgi:uncharacterized BrkB/YihY/UPF0761 family membrane protein